MELKDIRGVGPSRLEHLRAMGIVSLRDLLCALPVRYEDRTRIVPCREAAGEALVKGVVAEPPRLSRFSGLTRVTASLRDESGRLALCWYNAPWMMQQLPVGEPLMLFGRVSERNGRRALQNPAVVTRLELLPVYRPVKGIPAKTFREMVQAALAAVDECCPETLPQGLRLRHGLCGRGAAIRQSHFPESFEALRLARRRLAFEEMLLYQAALSAVAGQRGGGFPLPIPAEGPAAFWERLPFAPTAAQRRVLEEIAADLRQDRAMSRLVQGDVGCGKTALAFGAMALVCAQGWQCAMMAPTEILARQHYESARALLEPMGLRCGLMVGSMRAKEKREAHEKAADGSWDIVFGTHALISEGVSYRRLGLVVTDEQHRFGVRQRSALQERGEAGGRGPHVLVMSATPIPRTLALILYGDLDLSVVDELPPGRTPVRTRLVPEEKRAGMYAFLRDEVRRGRQAYVVCPLVEDSEQLEDVRSAQATYRALRDGELKDLRVGLTWGGQKPDEKEQTLAEFTRGELDVLVSTTVIEVGVNVPNASVMIVENAERFGLSQLHQLRGRVGRGSAESWCFLVAEGSSKLRILTQTNDGFLVAQKDLEQRGPGDLLGTRQSGEAVQGFLLNGDVQLLEESARCWRELASDPARAEERVQVERAARARFAERGLTVARN